MAGRKARETVCSGSLKAEIKYLSLFIRETIRLEKNALRVAQAPGKREAEDKKALGSLMLLRSEILCNFWL